MISFAAGLAILSSHVLLCFAIADPEELVNIQGGTTGRYDLSRGNALPLITTPWGFNSWAPMTDDDSSYSGWWFHPSDMRYFGMRCTHQPSPWINDYGQFRVQASITDPSHSGSNQYSGYDPKRSSWHPYYFATELFAYGTVDGFTKVEFTSTSHGAVMRVRYPPFQKGTNFEQTRRIMIVLNGGRDSSSIGDETDAPTMTGTVTKNSGGVGSGDAFGHYFVAQVYTTAADGSAQVTQPIASGADSNAVWMNFDAEDAATEEIVVHIATSFISIDQALVNLEQEVSASVTFEEVEKSSKSQWNDVLSRMDVEDVGSGYTDSEADDMLNVFYTALYRASIFPRQISEVNAEGELVHWSPYDSSGGVFPGPLTTDSGFWDAYSTVYPYLSIVNPGALGTMIQGWLNAYQEGGWLPKWASPGYRGSMVGTMGDVTLADAIVKKIPGFDAQLAYEAIRKDAFEAPPSDVDGVGRVCLPSYLDHGYIPKNSATTQGGSCDEAVSRTLNYMQSDFATAQAAVVLGHQDDADVLSARAFNYSLLFESETAFFRSKQVLTGAWTEGFDEFAWGGDYTESGPWQYRFYVPWDAMGLSSLYAESSLNMCEVLQQAQTMPSLFHLGAYGTEIHEQMEMVQDCWGQYACNNQPVHHMLYMFGASDADGVQGACSSQGQYWLRKAQRELYLPGTAMFPGDEDNGQMSAWYLLSSMGLYALSPGTTEYVFGSPQFGSLSVKVNGGQILLIRALHNSEDNVYVQSISWNGVVLPSAQKSIAYETLMDGGILEFTMGSHPATV